MTFQAAVGLITGCNFDDVGVSLAEAFPLIAIIGSTASGKSALALELARRIGAEILCVDSMTVYRGMDIGTAKPSAQERAEVPHHLLDVADPTESFTAARFVELADEVIADASRRKVPLIAVGGTPMYFKTLFEGLFEGPSADAALRERLMSEPLDVLYERLRKVDPEAITRIHGNDQRRIVRALEVYELTGKAISDHQREWGVQVRHPAKWIGIRWETEAVNRRINARVKQMMQAGWLEEVRGLLDRHGTLSKTAAEATGYAELIAHLQGRMKLEDAFEQIKIHTRQLARRQTKWFRRFEKVHWVDGLSLTDSQRTNDVTGDLVRELTA
jgi:tRNA dimethylallyltransferase